jgi:hypothetical protein
MTEYKTNQVSLNITTDNVNSDICYSLDGQANVTLPQDEAIHLQDYCQYNLSLLGLTDGMHVLSAYAKDIFGNTASTIANFRVNTATSPTEKPSPSPIQITNLSMIMGGVIVGAVIVAVALLVVYRKHNLKMKVEREGTENKAN